MAFDLGKYNKPNGVSGDRFFECVEDKYEALVTAVSPGWVTVKTHANKLFAAGEISNAKLCYAEA